MTGKPDPAADGREAGFPTLVDAGVRIGDYLLEGRLGQGGMGVVFRARHLRLHRVVALKMLPFGRFSPDVHQRRFQVEAEAVAQLRHPNIVTLYEVGEHEGQPFLSMEFVEGPDLGNALQTRLVSIRESARLIERVARAIQYAHGRGIAHRDLKPSNILIDAEGEPRVTDFGLARNAHSREVTLAGQPFGSPNYVPPEQAAGRNDSNPFASDVYGLGAILYHLLARRPPFSGESIAAVLQQVGESEPLAPRLLNPQVPRDLQTICLKCLEKDPARRYASAGAVADELGRFLRSEPITARPIGPVERTWRWCRRSPALATMTALTAFVLCAGLGTSLALWRQAQQRAEEVTDNLLRVEMERVEDLFNGGQSPEALARLARLLRGNPRHGDVVAQRTISALAHRNFLLPASPEFENVHDGAFSALAGSPQRLVTADDGGRTLVIWNVAGALERFAELRLPAASRVAALNADGSRLAVVLRDRTVQFWSVSETQRLTHSATLPRAATRAQLNPGGSRLLVTFAPRGAALVDGNDGRLLRFMPEPHFSEMSPDGRWFVTVRNAEASLWNADSGEPANHTWRHAYRIESARFSADSSRLVTSSADASVRVWDVNTAQAAGPPLLHQEHVLDAIFSPDGQRVLTRVLSERGQLWDVITGVPMGSKFPLTRTLAPAQFSPDGLSLVTQFSDRVRLRDAFTGEPIAEPIVTGRMSAVRFLDDGRRLLTTRFSGPTQLWSLQPGDAAPLILGHRLDLAGAVFSPDGNKVLTFAKDASAQIWSSADGRPAAPRFVHQRRLTRAVFDHAGNVAATGDADGVVNVWDVHSGALRAGPLEHGRDVTALAFSADDRRLVVATASGSVSVWDVSSGARVLAWQHGAAVRALELSPGGMLCASAGDRIVRVWDLSSGGRVAEFQHDVNVPCIAFSPDGKTLAAGDLAGRIRLWDMEKKTETRPPHSHTATVNSVRFSRDGRLLATASADHTARVWDVFTGTTVTRPLVHHGDVVTAAVSPDQRSVLTASYDGTARVWSLATSLPITDALKHGNRVESAAWSPDGRRIVTASWDASGRIWAIPQLHTTANGAGLLADIAEAFGRLQLGSEEKSLRVAGDQLANLQENIEVSNDGSDFSNWMRWLLSDRTDRAIAPGATVSAGEHARAHFAGDRADRVRQMLRLAPMDSKGLARWSWLVLQQPRERNPRRLREAALAAELAARIDPACFEAWCSLAQARLAAGETGLARSAFLRAQAAAPAELSPAERRAFADLRRRLEQAIGSTARSEP